MFHKARQDKAAKDADLKKIKLAKKENFKDMLS